VPIAMQRWQSNNGNAFLDGFFEQAIAARELAFAGGGRGPDHRVIEIGTITDPIEACVQPIRRWLDARADVAPYVIRPLVDVWHGPFDDLKTIDEPVLSPDAGDDESQEQNGALRP
jgi:uncharacterized protein YggL (DUF469 family)